MCTPSVLCLVKRMSLLGIKSFFCECPVLTKPIQLVSIGQEVHFDVYLECSQKESWVS